MKFFDSPFRDGEKSKNFISSLHNSRWLLSLSKSANFHYTILQILCT